MTKTVVYPGTFDPLTKGHLDLILRAASLFDKLIVVVGENTGKKPLFSCKERIEMIEEIIENHKLKNVEVDLNHKLTVEYAKEKGAMVLIRGVRAFSDFEYELQMASMNRSLAAEVETVFLMPKNEYSYINSSLIKSLAHFNLGEVEKFVPKSVFKRLEKKF